MVSENRFAFTAAGLCGIFTRFPFTLSYDKNLGVF